MKFWWLLLLLSLLHCNFSGYLLLRFWRYMCFGWIVIYNRNWFTPYRNNKALSTHETKKIAYEDRLIHDANTFSPSLSLLNWYVTRKKVLSYKINHNRFIYYIIMCENRWRKNGCTIDRVTLSRQFQSKYSRNELFPTVKQSIDLICVHIQRSDEIFTRNFHEFKAKSKHKHRKNQTCGTLLELVSWFFIQIYVLCSFDRGF